MFYQFIWKFIVEFDRQYNHIFLSCCLLFETTLKKRIFYFIVFYTAFAGVEIIFEFTLSLVIGDGYQWYSQTQLSRLIVTCLEKLVTFITLFIIEKN